MIKIKIPQSTLQRTFQVKHKNKTYYIDYLNSDGQILGLSNRDYWEILDQGLEELNIYVFKDTTKKSQKSKISGMSETSSPTEMKQIGKNVKLTNKLIKFCQKHFNDYKPEY